MSKKCMKMHMLATPWKLFSGAAERDKAGKRPSKIKVKNTVNYLELKIIFFLFIVRYFG